MFLGLDLSLTGTGVCILDDDGELVLATKITSTPCSDDIVSRFNRFTDISNNILSVIKPYSEAIRCVSIEMYSFLSNGKITQLVESGTIIRMMLMNTLSNCVIKEVTPQSLKKFIAGDIKGERKKDIIIKEVYKRFNIDVNDDNEADAVVLAKIAKAVHDKIYYNDYITDRKSVV